jgi:hypothetical protein
LAWPSGIEAEEPGKSPVLLGIQLLIGKSKISLSLLQGWQWSNPLGILGESSQKNSFGGRAVVRSSSRREGQDTSQTSDWKSRPKFLSPKSGNFWRRSSNDVCDRGTQLLLSIICRQDRLLVVVKILNGQQTQPQQQYD